MVDLDLVELIHQFLHDPPRCTKANSGQGKQWSSLSKEIMLYSSAFLLCKPRHCTK